jgi:hypothetical protein
MDNRYIDEDERVTKDGIQAWVQNNKAKAGRIAIYCNVPSKEKIEEIYNLCKNCTEPEKAQKLADFKQDCIVAKINGEFFDMGKIGGKKKTNRRRRKKTKRRLTVRLHK